MEDGTLELLYEAWVRRIEKNVARIRNGRHEGIRPYWDVPTIRVPAELQKRLVQVRRNTNSEAYLNEQMGEIVAIVLDVVQRGGGRRDVEARLREELR